MADLLSMATDLGAPVTIGAIGLPLEMKTKDRAGSCGEPFCPPCYTSHGRNEPRFSGPGGFDVEFALGSQA